MAEGTKECREAGMRALVVVGVCEGCGCVVNTGVLAGRAGLVSRHKFGGYRKLWAWGWRGGLCPACVAQDGQVCS
jgi:hypothetical protein